MKKSQKRKALICSLVASLSLGVGGLFACEEPQGSDAGLEIPCSHSITGEVITVEPTCFEEGEMKKICLVCGESSTEVVPAKGHTYEFESDEEGHFSKCVDCGDEIAKESHQLAWVVSEEDQTKHKEQCVICEYVTQEGNHDGADVYEKSSTHHYHHCSICDLDYGMGEHDFSSGTLCSECKYVFASVGLEFEPVNAGTAYSVCGIGTEEGTLVGIPEEYQGLPVVAISARAFEGNGEISTIIIPETVKVVGENAFNACAQLKTVSYAGSVDDWAKIDFKTIGSNPLSNGAMLYAGGELVEEVTLFNMEDIRAFTFAGCTSLKKLVAKGNITSIGEAAFKDCINLETITVSSASTIGNQAFKNCKKLKAFAIPANVQTIGEAAFIDCLNLETLTFNGSKVYSIGDKAFMNCASLQAVTMPSSVETIGENVFENCSRLKTATFASGSKIEILPKETFKNCLSMQTVTLPSRMEVIEEDAFLGCSSLVKVTMPQNLTIVKQNAFKNCVSIKEVYFNGVLSAWFNIDFDNKEANPLHAEAGLYNAGGKVEELSLPTNCGIIKPYALINCTSITKIIANSNLTVIGEEAMSGCKNLVSIEAENSNLIEIQKGAFKDCALLKSINWSSNITTIEEDAFNGCSSLSEINLEIAYNLETIGARAFSGCTSVRKVTLPNSIKNLNEDAFKSARTSNVYYQGDVSGWTKINFATEASNPMHSGANLYFDGSLVKELMVTGTENVKANTFVGCLSLKKLTLNYQVKNVEFGAFKGCKNITDITLPFIGESKNSLTNTHFGYIFGASSATDNKKFTPNYIQSLTITASQGATKIEKIDANAFYGVGNISVLTLPSEIKSFGTNAFYGTKVSKFILCGPNVDYINGDYAWSLNNFSNEQANPMHSGASIYYSWDLDNEITTLTITQETKAINNYAFVGAKITSILCEEESNPSRIGKSAFNGCLLEYVELPYIGESKDSSIKHFGYIFGADSAEQNGTVVPQTLTAVKLFNVDGVKEEAFLNCRYIDTLYLDFIESNLNFEADAFKGAYVEKVVYECGDNQDKTLWANFTFANKEANPMHNGAGLYFGFTETEAITEFSDITKINDFAFVGCNTIEYVRIPPNRGISDMVVGESAFEGAIRLNTVKFVEGVARVKYNAFKNCPALKDVMFDGKLVEWFNIDFANKQANPLSNGANFYNYNSGNPWFGENKKELVGDVNLSESTITTLKSNSIAGCVSLKNIIIPSTVTKIEQGALDGCVALEKVALPYLGKELGDANTEYLGYIFGANSFLENAKFVPSSLKEVKLLSCEKITASAFKGVNGLTTIKLPANAITFEDGAFSGCTIKSVYFIDSNKTAEENLATWAGCTFESLDSNPMHNGAALYLEDSVSATAVSIINTASINEIKPYTFAGLITLTDLEVTDNLVAIGEGAFKNCLTLASVNTLVDVNVGFGAFEGCNSIKELTISSTGSYDGKVSHFGYIFGAETYQENGKVPASLVKVNALIEGKIADHSFDGCVYIKNVVIGDEVIEIGNNAFANCDKLDAVEFSAQSKLVKFGNYAFAFCRELDSIIVPATIVETGYGAFSGCSTLKNVSYLGANESNWAVIEFGMGGNPLENGANLKINGETLEDAFIDLTEDDAISAYAFKGCKSLKSVTIKGVKYIGDNAFENCTSLASFIIVGDTLTNIGNNAFKGCIALKEIVIPESVVIIGENAFSELASLTIKANVESLPLSWDIDFANGVKEILWKNDWNPTITPPSVDIVNP